MKKICYFGSDYPPTGGGIATYTVEWLSVISQSREVSTVCAYIFGNKQPRKEKINEKLIVTTRKTDNFFKIGIEIFHFMYLNKDADVLHALYVFPVGFWMVVWSKIFRIPSVVTIYGTDVCSLEGSRLTQRLKRFTLLRATKVIAISKSTKGATIRAMSLPGDGNVVEVIYNAVPKVKTKKTEEEIDTVSAELKQKLSIGQNDFVILAVARLVPRKGLDYLIQAVAAIPDIQTKLLIVGDGPEREKLKEEIKSKALEHRVFLLGKVPDIVPLYRLSKLAALVSFDRVSEGDFEGLGLVLLEGQSFGLPVIGTDSGGIPEAFEPGVTGILVPQKDVSGLSQAIEKLRDDSGLYAKMSLATNHFLEERFGEDRMIKQYFSLLDSLSMR